MKAMNCCKTMEAELTAWKSNIYDIVRSVEQLPGGKKEKILPNIEDLHMLTGKLDDRIEQIRADCTPETGIDDIRAEKEQFDKLLITLRMTANVDTMQAMNCCKTMEAELTAWKANVYDIVRNIENLPGGDKEKVLPNIEDLHMLIAEMDDRIDGIRENCTPETGIDDIRTERKAFDDGISKIRVSADEAMQILGAGNFGG